MEALESIFNRRSIRRYSSRKVEKEKIIKIIEAGMFAPSAHNRQPWHFVPTNDRGTMLEIADKHPYAKMLKTADWAILVCGDLNLESSSGYLAVDCAAATENMMLAAYSLGLGTVWIAVYPREERIRMMREIFKLPANIEPISLIAVGYPDEKKPKPNRFNPSRIHWDKWE